MYLGSGDTTALLSGIDTKGHLSLLQRFVSDVKPNYNAKASPIDALRIGAILEERYISQFEDDNFYPQVLAVCPSMDVLICHLDIAKVEEGKIIEFIEVKTVGFVDFQEMILMNSDELLNHVMKVYKNYYNQVQQQLICTGLKSAEIHFIQVFDYDDNHNYERVINPAEVLICKIDANIEVQGKIMDRAQLFQCIKDHFKN